MIVWTLTRDAFESRRNLSVAWLDFKKAYDMGSRRRLQVRSRLRHGHEVLSASRFGNVKLIAFRGTAPALARPAGGGGGGGRTTAPSRRSSPFSQDRLTHIQLPFTWNPSPRQSANSSSFFSLSHFASPSPPRPARGIEDRSKDRIEDRSKDRLGRNQIQANPSPPAGSRERHLRSMTR